MNGDKQPTEDYIRVLSHQLKSPINAIESLLNTLLEGYAGNLDEQTLYILKKAVKRSGDARAMISDLLDFELYAEKQYGDGDEIDIVKLCDGLTTRFSVTASDKSISLRTQFPRNTGVFVRGDERGLEHALRNLLENAIKYTPEGGSVGFSVSLDTNKGICDIEIADTGSGLPENEIEHIFEPFYRASIHRSGIPGTRVIIIGGVTAGPKAAARLRRLDERARIAERKMVLAMCPCCEFQLRVSADKRQWAVFEAMIELMTPKGFAALMGTMWPELIDAMPLGMGGMMRVMGKVPGALTLMKPMFPVLFPILLPKMMPKLLPTMLERIGKMIPMPDYMAEQMPGMMPGIMDNLMPHMIGDVVPLVTDPMIKYLKGKKEPA